MYEAEFVINNIARANLNNTLKISDDVKENELEFCDNIIRYLSNNINKDNESKFSKAIELTLLCKEKLSSGYKYSKEMIMDEYVINLWRIMR